MTNANAFVTLELRKFEAQCLNARTAVGRARTLAELKRARDVSPPAIIRPLIHSLADYRALEAETDQRAQEIVRERLEALRRTPTADLKNAEAEFKRKVLRELRGESSQLYRWAEREFALVLRERGER